jgi:hypothetical protein
MSLSQSEDASIFRRIYNEAYLEGFLKMAPDLTRKTKEITDESNIFIPNRHGVLHGVHKNYGSRRNALKCFSFLLFVMFAIHGDVIYTEAGEN